MNERYQNVRNKSSDMARNMREGYHQRTHELRHRANYLIEDRPLALVAIGFGIGAALGLMIPSTRREDEMMGSARDRLRDRAMEESHAQFERAREEVESAAEAARKQAQEQTQEENRSGSDSSGSSSGASSSASGSSAQSGTTNSKPGQGDGKSTTSSASPR